MGAIDQQGARLSAYWAPSDDVEVIARYTTLSDGGTSEGVWAAEGAMCAGEFYGSYGHGGD